MPEKIEPVTKIKISKLMIIRIVNRSFLICFLFGWYQVAVAQMALPESAFEKTEWEMHLRFLASDDLMGRRTGSEGIAVAANYIREAYKKYNLISPSNAENYYQSVPLSLRTPPAQGQFTIGDLVFTHGDNLMILSGEGKQIKARIVFAGHGEVNPEKGIDDYKGLDVDGAVVVVLPGTSESIDPQVVFQQIPVKIKSAEERGAVGLLELYRLQFPWGFFKNYFGKPSMQVKSPGEIKASSLTYGWLKEENLEVFNNWRQGNTALEISGGHSSAVIKDINCQNVAGIVYGTDPKLKDEFIIVTGHYDHVGTGKDGGGFFSEQDSIFNGARDNAMGTVALLAAAKAIGKEPLKRSVLFVALTGEELGLLGSSYYVSYPLIPLNQTVFNLNTDGAGYNDTKLIGVIGYGRTGTDHWIEQAAEFVELEVVPNPAPRQNLFDRSDNVSFAVKGIPAINISPGFKDFDAEINKYYHQVADEVDSIDFDYLLKYCKMIAHSLRLIGNSPTVPTWKAGDKYEEAGKALYGIE
jgi:hypothetical protein